MVKQIEIDLHGNNSTLVIQETTGSVFINGEYIPVYGINLNGSGMKTTLKLTVSESVLELLEKEKIKFHLIE